MKETLLVILGVLIAGIIGYGVGRASLLHPICRPDAESPPQVSSLGSTQASTAIGKPAFDIAKREGHPPLGDREAYARWVVANIGEEETFVRWRWDCAQDLLKWTSIKDSRVLEAFLRTPREIFIRKKNKTLAYAHRYLPIGYGATITDPWVVSIMTQTINPNPEHRVLEIGTGSGYQSAMLAQLSNYVYTIEIIEPLAAETDGLYKEMRSVHPEYVNIIRKVDDGYYGWPEYAPFDRIIVTCSIDHVPPDLLKQLTPGGIMVIPVGPPAGQTLMKITKAITDEGYAIYERKNIMPVKFIPFTRHDGSSYSNAGGD